MASGKIVMLPLDERPCNFDYPGMMPKTDYTLILPPKEIMGQKKTPGDTQKIAQWLLQHVDGADAMVLALDTLVYGGIIPSRLHHLSQDELIERADLIKELRRRNPTMKLYVFGLIMRCPSYSSNDEEPDYYEECGAELHLYGRYSHLEKLGKLTEADQVDFQRVKTHVKEEYLNDYLNRRKTNLAVLMHALQYAADGTVDHFIVPQDDSAVYGFTAIDQVTVREFLKSNVLHKKTAMYPSADDTGVALLAKAMADLHGVKPRIYIHYASMKGHLTVPQVEDRMVGETLKYHILSVGGIQVYSLMEADIVLAVNVGSAMLDPGDPGCVTAYDIERNLAEFVNYIEYALSMGKIVAIADIAWLNKADTELTALLREEDLLLKIHAYAGWNTSSNTTGTTLCQAVLYMLGKDEAGNRSFLLHRYYEDIGYMAFTRQHVVQNILPGMGLDYFHADGQDGQVAAIVRDTVSAYMEAHYPALAALVDTVTVRQPWSRMFETDIKLTLK